MEPANETIFTFAKYHLKALTQLEALLKQEGQFVAFEKVRTEEERRKEVVGPSRQY
jgi:hypothetical protein